MPFERLQSLPCDHQHGLKFAIGRQGLLESCPSGRERPRRSHSVSVPALGYAAVVRAAWGRRIGDDRCDRADLPGLE